MIVTFKEPFPRNAFLNRGLSIEARQVDLTRNAENIETSFYMLQRKNLILSRLADALSEALTENIEVFETYQANSGSLPYTLEFLNRLAPSLPLPEIELDNDGDFALDWDYGPRRILSIRVGKDGTLNFAWLVGYSSFHGVTTLTDYIPNPILDGLESVATL